MTRLYKHAPDGRFVAHHPPRPPPTATAAAKDRARRAWQACRADPQLALMGDRVWSETLTATRGTADAARIEAMYSRTAVLLEILLDRRGWPSVVRGL